MTIDVDAELARIKEKKRRKGGAKSAERKRRRQTWAIMARKGFRRGRAAKHGISAA